MGEQQRHSSGRAQSGQTRCRAKHPVRTLRGLRTECQRVGRLETFEVGGPTAEEEPLERQCQDQHFDEGSGVAVNPEAAQAARALEVVNMHKLKSVDTRHVRRDAN